MTEPLPNPNAIDPDGSAAMAALAALDDHALARALAEEAGTMLVSLRARLVADGMVGRTLAEAGDRAAHELLMTRLAHVRPDDEILSEEGSGTEGPAGRSRLTSDRVWIVDPLDGSREFGEPSRPDWAVHVALVTAGSPVAGAVALPAQRRILGTSPAAPTPPAPPARPRLIVSRTRPPAVARYLAEVLGGDLVPMGSAGAKAAAVVLGAADIYAHAGGQYEWDSCAPAAVARAAGVWASRLDGSPLIYNNADPYLPDLLICHPLLVDQVHQAIATYLAR